MKYSEVDRNLKFKNEKQALMQHGEQVHYILVSHPANFKVPDPNLIREWGYSIRKRQDEDEYTVHSTSQVVRINSRTKERNVVEVRGKMRATMLLNRNNIDMRSLSAVREEIIRPFRSIESRLCKIENFAGGV